MMIQGFDRFDVLVRDMDPALELFSRVFGLDFQELDPQISARDGLRSCVSHAAHFHLVAPMLPLSERLPPPMRKRLAQLDARNSAILALTLTVEDAVQAEVELTRLGIGVEHRYAPTHDYLSIGMDNFAETVTAQQDSLGIIFGLASYLKVVPSWPARQTPVKVRGLERVVLWVRNIEAALSFFSGKLNLQFHDVSAGDGARCWFCPDVRLQITELRAAVPEHAPEFLTYSGARLRDAEAVVHSIVFKVDDASAAANMLSELQIRTIVGSAGAMKLKETCGAEVVCDPRDTLGLVIGLAH